MIPLRCTCRPMLIVVHMPPVGITRRLLFLAPLTVLLVGARMYDESVGEPLLLLLSIYCKGAAPCALII